MEVIKAFNGTISMIVLIATALLSLTRITEAHNPQTIKMYGPIFYF